MAVACAVMFIWHAAIFVDACAGQGIVEAAAAGDAALVGDMAASGVDIETTDREGATALMRASENGRYNTVKELVELGADVDARDKKKRTALMHAASNGHVVVGRMLVAAGGSITAKDASGSTAGDIARDSGYLVMSEALEAESGKSGGDEAVDLKRRMSELYREGKLQDAAGVGEKLTKLLHERLGPDHPLVAEAENDLGVVYDQTGNDAKAEAHYMAALEINEKALGTGHPVTAASVSNLGVFYFKRGDIALARELLGRALGIRSATLGPAHPLTAQSMENMAVVMEAGGDREKAAGLHNAAQKIMPVSKDYEHSGQEALVQGPLAGPLATTGWAGPLGNNDENNPGQAVPSSPRQGMPGSSAGILKVAGILAILAVAGFAVYRSRLFQRLWKYDFKREKRAKIEFELVTCYEKAGAAERAGEFDKSAALYERVLEIDPNHHRARFNLARVYHLGTRNTFKAREHYAELMKKVPVGHAFYREAASAMHTLDGKT